MEFKVRNGCIGQYCELIVDFDGGKIESGLLDKGEGRQMAYQLINSAADILSRNDEGIYNKLVDILEELNKL